MHYTQTDANPEILGRISEADVCAWMAARLAQMRRQGVPAHALELGAWCREDGHYDTSWTGHALGECDTACGDSAMLERSLHHKLTGGAESAAQRKRAEAERLLKEAQELEALTKTAAPWTPAAA